MKEIKKCSISGVAFTMDVDAYQDLAGYLDSLKKSYRDNPDGGEIIADIEARIAELILMAQDNERVVERGLILNVIQQMGSVEDISEQSVPAGSAEEPRIPRRLYRDTENAKLGGVCAGIGKYFDIDPVWVRLGIFFPLVLIPLHWASFMWWISGLAGNLFGIFVVCYLIMWFAVPAARTARQKLEMSGEKITAQSIGETTAAASNDADAKAKPIVANVVSTFGQVVLIVLKIFAGLLVFGLILAACALIIGLFSLAIGGPEILNFGTLSHLSMWVPVLGIFVALIPTGLLIYVLMCLIASRKPGGKTVLVVFLLWLASIIALSCVAIRENMHDKVYRSKHSNSISVDRMLNSQKIEIDGVKFTLGEVIASDTLDRTVEEDDRILRISIPSKRVDVKIDKWRSKLTMTTGDRTISVEDGSETVKTTGTEGQTQIEETDAQ